MKVSKRDIYLLIGFAGILAAVCSYFFVFQPLMEKTEVMLNENISLQAQVAQLQEWSDKKDYYLSETERMEKEIKDIYQVFPVDVREEDCILAAINQELIAPMDVSSMTIEPKVEVDFSAYIANTQNAAADTATVDVSAATADVSEAAAEADAALSGTSEAAAVTNTTAQASTSIGILQNRQATMNYEVSYDGLKRSVKNFVAQTNRMAIEGITVAYDDTTGLLIGSTTLNMYCVPGQEGKEYVQPDFSSVLLGSDNIFGTIIVNREAAEGAEDAENENEESEETTE